MKYLLWTGSMILFWGWWAGIGDAAPTWNPIPTGNALQGNTTLTLSENYTQSSALTGNYSLTVAGGHVLEITTPQQYTGGTIVKEGTTVKLNGSTSGGMPGYLPNRIQLDKGTLEIASGAQMGYENTATITSNGGNIRNTSNTHAILKDLSLSNGSTIEATVYNRTGWGGDFALDGNLYVTAGDNLLKAQKIVLSARYSGTPNTVTTDVSSGASLSIEGSMQNLLVDAGDFKAGPRTLRKTGEGTLKLLENQLYTGSTIVEEGTLDLAVASDAPIIETTKAGLLLGTIVVQKEGALRMSATGVMGYGMVNQVLDIQGGTVENTSDGHNLLCTVKLSEGGVIRSDVTGTTGWGGNYALDGDITATSGNNLIQAEKLVLSSRYTSTQYTNRFDIQGEDTVLTLDGNLLNPTGTIDTRPRNLKKTGSGTLVLKGLNNTYSGITEVTEGTLRIDTTNKSSSQESLSLLSDVVINGGRLFLTVNGSTADNLFIDGKLQLQDEGSLLIDVGDNLPLVGEVYPILSATEGIWLGDQPILSVEDFFPFLTENAQHYLFVLPTENGFALTTNSAAVPEPGTWLLWILGFGFLWLRRRFQ